MKGAQHEQHLEGAGLPINNDIKTKPSQVHMPEKDVLLEVFPNTYKFFVKGVP
jgi:hypothetical protein